MRSTEFLMHLEIQKQQRLRKDHCARHIWIQMTLLFQNCQLRFMSGLENKQILKKKKVQCVLPKISSHSRESQQTLKYLVFLSLEKMFTSKASSMVSIHALSKTLHNGNSLMEILMITKIQINQQINNTVLQQNCLIDFNLTQLKFIMLIQVLLHLFLKLNGVISSLMSYMLWI